VEVIPIDGPELTRAVSRLLADPDADPVRPVAYPVSAGAGQGSQVYRVQGQARSRGRLVSWSLIVKAISGDTRGPPDGWCHSEREVLAYRSGLLRKLPGGLSAPRCLAHGRDAAGRHCLWLEDLGPQHEPWSLTTYAGAARCLGRFNGAYLAGLPIPEHPWLSRHWLRRWLDETAPAVAALPEHRDHPLVRRAYPPDVAAAIAKLWAGRDEALRALDRLPQSLCHHDAFRRNLVAVGDRIAALDWAFTGPGPVGAELSPLIAATLAFGEFDLDAGPELERVVMASYLTGLREAGWHGSDEQVWFGYAATSALRYGPGTVRLVLPILLNPALQDGAAALLGIPFDAVIELWAAVIRAQVALAR
jgi:hypothetical protein